MEYLVRGTKPALERRLLVAQRDIEHRCEEGLARCLPIAPDEEDAAIYLIICPRTTSTAKQLASVGEVNGRPFSNVREPHT